MDAHDTADDDLTVDAKFSANGQGEKRECDESQERQDRKLCEPKCSASRTYAHRSAYWAA